MNDVTGRVIVGPHDQESVAVVTVALPAEGALYIDPTWRFEGFLGGVEIVIHAAPARFDVQEDGTAEERRQT